MITIPQGTSSSSENFMIESTALDALVLVLFTFIVYHSSMRRNSKHRMATQSCQLPPCQLRETKPKDGLFTAKQLKMYDGSNPERLI
jgi:hypothetical protein